ncbi:MAG: right-handed parallel beta-helix repeat-containing protein [Fimbriimonadaceae bacterium]|nr:right-handed parallel beta-helix repeat-containing protein [Fimbriimonadaceae bacterium]
MLPVLLALSFQQVRLTPGLVLSKSATVAKGVYALPNASDDGSSAAIVVEGDGITVDFHGAVLEGTPPDTAPDQRAGTGVIVKGKNVTIKNLVVRGYRHGLIARNVPGLKILDSDFSYNWKQHLLSTLEREDGADWMSFHQNEKDEWLRYGEGIYLRGCGGFEVRGCTVVGGQSGLMLTECDNGKIWNNNFSFLSALGLGMYRSSRNVVMHNNIDWCVRGHSEGVYNRGQDSAGILVYEQSNFNTFAYNSVTHGGDGFFLWAGQTTMDTGRGGCNDNLLYANDFSHAPTNGIEATFSRNTFANNLILECWHGIWGGYSYDTKVLGNVFGLNAEGIALEHGQDIAVRGNVFRRDLTALAFWQNDTQDPNWAYPKNRDTRSRDTLVEGNVFEDIAGAAFRLRNSAGFVVRDNVFDRVAQLYAPNSPTKASAFENNSETGASPSPAVMQGSGLLVPVAAEQSPTYLQRFATGWEPYSPWTAPEGPRRLLGETSTRALESEIRTLAPKPLPGGRNPFLRPGTLRGRMYILVDEWGPYDFKSPKLWPRGKNADGSLRFQILGPKGKWNATTFRGATLSASSGDVPGWVDVRVAPGKATDLLLDFEYRGAAVVTPFGQRIPAGKAVRFEYRKFFTPIDWTVKWFAYDKATQEPRTMLDAFHKLLEGTPLKTEKTDTINYAWGGSPGAGVPDNYFATLAEGKFEVPAGEYTLNVTSDDGVRVWVDGKVVIDNWTYHGPTLDTAKLKLGGAHRIRVEHFEIDGYSTLKVELKPDA